MEEVSYLDRAALATYDLPPGWQMALDERKAIAGPVPSGAPIFFRRRAARRRASSTTAARTSRAAAAADLVAAPPGTVDPRFIGRTAPHALTLEFDDADRRAGRALRCS